MPGLTRVFHVLLDCIGQTLGLGIVACVVVLRRELVVIFRTRLGWITPQLRGLSLT